MAVNKDDPGTWLKYKSLMCNSCRATCCTMPVEVSAEDLIRLEVTDIDEVERGLKKVATKLIKQGLVSQYREKTGLLTLSQKSNSDCYFLDSKRMCTVYEKRPDVCRKFPTQMSRRINHCPYSPK